jgi:P-type Mg2+ transporter
LEKEFWQYQPAEIYKQTGSSEKGLSTVDALNKLKAAGHVSTTPGWIKEIKTFLGQFKSPLVLLLIAAVILSAVIGEKSDALIILIIVLATGILSFVQERSASKTVEKLQKLITVKSTVIRDGKETDVPSADIVPGDILVLNSGDMVPADSYLLESNELNVNEASLTGESFPVRKEVGVVDAKTLLAKRTNSLWQGSSIVSGSGKAIVVFIGADTVFGGIAKSASDVTETAFEKGIKHFGIFLMQVTLVLAVVILAINLISHKPLFDSLLFALAIAVGMAPELLPAISTIAMSAGANRMLQKKVIVKKLSAIQNLGEVNLFCTDKTGTITEGIIKVAGTYDCNDKESDFVKELAFLNAKFESGYGNPIDEALKSMQVTAKGNPQKTGEVPYDFERKRLSIAIKRDNEQLLITKGAFKQILEISSSVRIDEGKVEPMQQHLEDINKLYDKFGEGGLRVLAIAYKPITQSNISKDDEKELIFAGFILLEDPIKAGLQDSLKALADLHVEVKIITGDNKVVAASIGKKIGLENPGVLTGEDMDKMADEALTEKAYNTDIFAEVEPRQKERIITALRNRYVVAYMGDGINDVAAINAADVGISTDNAVDVAKSAADFVLLEKDLRVLADGITEGRKTFINTIKYILINTGSTFGNMFSVAVASLMLPFLPMLPIQILLTNFLTDIPFLAIAVDNVDAEALQKSSRWDIKQLRRYMVVFGLQSSLFDVLTFVTLYFVLKLAEGQFQTGWFIESVLTELFILFVMRTRKNFLTSKPAKLLLWLSLGALVFTLSLPYLPFGFALGMSRLSALTMLSIIGIIVLYVFSADLLKLWFFRTKEKNEGAV